MKGIIVHNKNSGLAYHVLYEDYKGYSLESLDYFKIGKDFRIEKTYVTKEEMNNDFNVSNYKIVKEGN